MKEARYIRPGMALGFFVVAVLLGMTSVASACTLFQGSLTITGKTSTGAVTPAPSGFPTNGNGSSLAWGSGSNMTYCSNGNPTGYAYAPAGPTALNPTALSGKATVAVAQHNCNAETSTLKTQLPSGTYDVNFLNVGAFTNYSNRNWVLDCMSTPTSATPNDLDSRPGVRAASTRKVGDIVVDINGSGTVTVNLDAEVPNKTTSSTGSTSLVPSEEAGICVSTPDAPGTPRGMQGPITIV